MKQHIEDKCNFKEIDQIIENGKTLSENDEFETPDLIISKNQMQIQNQNKEMYEM